MIRDSQKLEQLLQQTRSFVREVAIPHEEQVEREDCIPEPVVDQMRAAGMFGWSIPEAYGGLGLTSEELCLANMELSQCAVAFRARCGTNTGIGAEALIQDGTEEQRRQLLPRLASGELTSCLAVTEPDAGSDLLGQLATTAERTASGYVLSGTKRFITNAPIADLFTVLARTSDARDGSRSTTSFLYV